VADSVASVAAIEDLYRRRFSRFARVARASLGDDEQARDAVQEAFARAIRARFEFRGAGSLEGWLWRTLLNICRDQLRRAAEPLEAPRVNGQPDQWPELRAAVAALPERQRQAVFLRHYADLDYQSIAEVLGVERGTIAATLHAAHASLRETMTEVKT